jgi:hypothetical protein
MELLLNLAWLLLALPAFWLWHNARNARAEHKFTSWQCLMALGCLLVLLFPVISATDDLLAMRTEMEESPLSKRSIRQAGSDKSARNLRLQSTPALVGTHPSFALVAERSDSPVVPDRIVPAVRLVAVGRAPPIVPLA